MEKIRFSSAADVEKQLARPAMDREELEKLVSTIFGEVKRSGDEVIRKYTYFFDGVKLRDLQVSDEEMSAADGQVADELKEAIKVAMNNIERFHARQARGEDRVETTQGVTCWQRSVGIEKVGLYVPGGSAPLFSTVLMLAVPARLAGCREVVLCTPPRKDGTVDPAILYAARLAGVSKVYRAGGVQAVAGMTYGTESIPKVYKIFGPGNQYVTAAKMYAFCEGVAIDMPAGPSEVMVVADATANPTFVASDLLSQAEHGADSQVVLVAIDGFDIDAMSLELEKQLTALPRKAVAAEALAKSKVVQVANVQEALTVVNAYAPEHLIVSIASPSSIVEGVVNAGSVFVGPYTPESAGDYASGTNHTLPTNGFARAYSGLTLDSFTKTILFQEITPEGVQNLGRTIEVMAENEQLDAHKNAVSVRLRSLKNEG